LEMRLPTANVEADRDFTAQLASKMVELGAFALSLSPCYEIVFSEGWRSSVKIFLQTIASAGKADGLAQTIAWAMDLLEKTDPSYVTPSRACFKLRCGGLEASTFPSVEQVSAAIAACRDASVPLKFTAGLHHPIRHFSGEVQTKMHGFINVFVAG